MTNSEIASLLRKVAASYAILDDKKHWFQITAYHKAADSIEADTVQIADLFKSGKIENIPGIGQTIKSRLAELLEHGCVKYFDELMKHIPSSVFPLLDIPGFGPKKAYKLVVELKLHNPDTVIADIYDNAKKGKISVLDGFGSKSEADIIRAIDEYKLGKTKTSRMTLPYAFELAENILEYLKKSPDVIEAQPLGSLRRRMQTIGDIDIAAVSNNPSGVLDHFINFPQKIRVIEKGDKTASILVSSGKQIDLMIAPPEGFGSLLQHFTGSKAHNIHLRDFALSKKLSLSEYGIKKQKSDGTYEISKINSEEKFYNALGLQWIPPELREDSGEIEIAIRHELPGLIELKDIKGDFHIHSSYPIEPSHDLGIHDFDQMIQKAISLSYEYIGFSEHNPSISRHSPEEIYEILYKRNNIIEQMRLKYKNNIRIFSLLEIDILTDGKLAVDNKSLELLDAAIVSIHSSFAMDRDKMTKRVISGLSHPKAKILAHPTGRLLNQRNGYDLDWEKLFDFCKKNNKALEINSWPVRLDLPDTLVRKAKDLGIALTIDTDSHNLNHMDLMRYGVFVARRGWCTRNDILNTKTYNEIEQWFKL